MPFKEKSETVSVEQLLQWTDWKGLNKRINKAVSYAETVMGVKCERLHFLSLGIG